MSFESASNQDKSRWDADKHSLQSSFMTNGDDAALTGLFHQAFGKVRQSSPEISSEEEFPLDEFEANVMTSCLMSSVESVSLPEDFEDQVMARIRSDRSPAGDMPRSYKSPLLRHTSRELYRRYRRVVQVVFPLAAAASIVVALYVRDNSTMVEGWISSIFSMPAVESVQPDTAPQQPEMDMQYPVEPATVQPHSGNDGAAPAGQSKTKKKVKRTQQDRNEPITGE